MRGRGVTYDTGFISEGPSTHEPFDPEAVRRDLRVIREDLHCTAVRVTGSDPDRLEVAARLAADAGLEVWFSPFICDLTTDELLDFLADCADRAERLRRTGAEVVLVTAAELTLFAKGFLPGDTIGERIAGLMSGRKPAPLNDFLARAVAVVRERFAGKVTYASLPTEVVDWTPFDFVAADAYNSVEVAAVYTEGIRSLLSHGKPVAITEFGCTTHRGAAALGARGMFMVDWDGPTPLGLKAPYVRDEHEQATYLHDSLDVFEAEGVDTAFWCTFACYNLPDEYDVASYGLVRVTKDHQWTTKESFEALSRRFRALG
ncbi:hypothetical protein [Actinoplanes friuliensis]|uniref:Abortive infection protein n=1 Tax=Actinoplanes friuliensis DSM 7358 TaxID=1246995 RepID=U5W2G9_9ACTN|nr:hypothetical protein [Actinoplanes friuliensis]AGZ43329.1 hypothetical protein AFR_25315 [Actinoplanes friuliensis DSM 7358]